MLAHPVAALAPLRALVALPRLFCHRNYARTYLGSAAWAPLALAHYLLVGEGRGWLPNPFFEPAVFAEVSGTRSLLRYLGQPRLWRCSTSRRFDGAWYRKKARLPDDMNPLVDFWCRGFDKRIDPAPSVQLGWMRDAVCRDQWDDRRYLFALFARPSWQVPTNRPALRAAQDSFVAAINYRVLKRAPPRRPWLVFVQAGAGFAAAYAAEPRPFDLLVNYYDPPPRGEPLPAADIAIVQNGTKVTAIHTLLARDPSLLLGYEAVLFLDDDVAIEATAIVALFRAAAERGLDLAQASLTAKSGCFFACLKQPEAGAAVRRMNAVEIMMPLVSRRVLERLAWVFGEGVSGWAIDLLLGATVRDTFGDAAVGLVGSVVAAHERPVDTAGGRFYTVLRERGIDAATEAGDLISRYRLDPDIEVLSDDHRSKALWAAESLPDTAGGRGAAAAG